MNHFTPLFRFDKTSRELLFDLIKANNDTEITIDDIEFGIPVANGRIDTSIQITASPSSTLTGRVTIDYRRLDVNQFFFGLPINIETDNVEINEQLVSDTIFNKWGVFIEPEDMVVTYDEYAENLPIRVDIVIKEESLIWVGELVAWVLPSNHIGNLFKEHELSFNTATTKKNAFIYSVEKNIEGLPDSIVNSYELNDDIFTLDTRNTNLLTFLRDATGDNWVIEQTQTLFNLMDALVIYKGLYDDNDPTRGVIVIRLATSCKNLFGNLLINYTITEE